MSHSDVIVRMPPSPTGYLHLGTARTVLFNYLFAKSHKGKIIFRWEDTDRERSKTEFEEEILEGLRWLGMDFVAEKTEFRHQTDSTDYHQAQLQKLAEAGKVFRCYLTPEEVDQMREEAQKKKQNFVLWSRFRDSDEELDKPYVWRFKVPKDQEITWNDLIRGEVSVNSSTIGDFTVARSDGSILYPLANVLDDWEQRISHVIRGEDHISNTPKQLLIWEALDVQAPEYGHIPLVMNHAGAKLSKRNVEPGVCILVRDFRAEGFLPQAVINGLAFLGWHPKTEEENFSLSQLIERFSLEGINKASAKYDFEKMKWFNNAWMNQLQVSEIAERFLIWDADHNHATYENVDVTRFETAVSVCRQKAKTFKDLAEEMTYILFPIDKPNANLLTNEKMKVDAQTAQTVLNEMIQILKSWEGDLTADTIKEKCIERIQALELKNGQFLWPVRYSLSGREKSISPFDMIEILGIEESVKRLEVMV